MGGRGSSSGMVRSSVKQQIDAIHQFQQVSWEGITAQEKSAIKDFVNTNPDVTDWVARGMVVSESTINKWIDEGEVNHGGMNSWTTGNSAGAFASVNRNVDAEDGKRSVILVSPNGLPNSAKLPRTNAYNEDEVVTTVTKFKILNHREQRPYIGSTNKSPYETIITVEPIARK